MKTKYKTKIWWNWLHLVVIVLGVIIYLAIIGNLCEVSCKMGGHCPQPTFFGCLIDLLKDPNFLFVTLIGIGVLYLIITLISWVYYRNKK